jgi:hypothetical protein
MFLNIVSFYNPSPHPMSVNGEGAGVGWIPYVYSVKKINYHFQIPQADI